MDSRSWPRPMADESDAIVSLESTDPGGEVRFQVEFPFLVGDGAADDVIVTGGGTLEAHHLRSTGGVPVSDLVISIPEGSHVERLIVRNRPERIVVHLPSADLLETCDRALAGDHEAAEVLIDSFDSPLQIPVLCGSFLAPRKTVQLMQELVRQDRHVRSMLHSYRYALVRCAVVSPAGLYVRSYRELNGLVDGLDAISEIGEVRMVEALGDIVGTVHDSPTETERLLESLAVDFSTLDEGNDGLFTTCFLAHLADTVGVREAEAFEVPRKLPPRGHYERRKRGVLQAAYGNRGTAWRRLLDAARRQSEDEFGRILAYTLYWTGEESRSDSRMQELLLRGAEEVASQSGLQGIEAKARFARLVSAGHRLRGTHCWDPSVANFEEALRLTAETRFLDEWEPIAARGIVYSRQLSLDGDHEGAVDELDRTIDDLLGADPPTSLANRSVRHLRAQKCEIASLRYRSDDPTRARALLEEARDLYETIGFDRSVDKIDRILTHLPEVAISRDTDASPVEADVGQRRIDEEPVPVSSADQAVESPFDPDVPDEQDDDWLASLEYPDEGELHEPYDDRFDDPALL